MSGRWSAAQVRARHWAAVAIATDARYGHAPAERLAYAAGESRRRAARIRTGAWDLPNGERAVELDLADACDQVGELLEASHARLLEPAPKNSSGGAVTTASPAPSDDALPAQHLELFECDRPGCDAVIGIVGENGPDDEWDDYDPIAEHIARHELDDERNALPDVAGMRPGQMIDVDFSGRFVIVPAVEERWMLPVLQQRASSQAGLASFHPLGGVMSMP